MWFRNCWNVAIEISMQKIKMDRRRCIWRVCMKPILIASLKYWSTVVRMLIAATKMEIPRCMWVEGNRLATCLFAQLTGFVHLSNSTRVKVDRLQWSNYWSMPKPIFKPETMAPAACPYTTLHPRGTSRPWNNCSNWVHHICRVHQTGRCRSTMLVMLATLQLLNI